MGDEVEELPSEGPAPEAAAKPPPWQGEVELTPAEELAIMEAERKRAEEAAGKPIPAVEYAPYPIKTPPVTLVAVVVVVVILVIAALYLLAIPRADAELVIQYNEGLMGGINVDARVENHGTRDIEGLVVTIMVQNSTDTPMAETYTFEGQVPSHGRTSLEAISFQGDQWDTYHIFIQWTFKCAGKDYAGSEHLSTEGEAMNQWFTVAIT